MREIEVSRYIANRYLLYFVLVFPAFTSAAEETSEKTKNSSGVDIKLESTFIGDKEQPAVSYFIPWQGTSTPDKLQWDMQQKHDATLQLIDREVMLRSVNMYDDMNMENAN